MLQELSTWSESHAWTVHRAVRLCTSENYRCYRNERIIERLQRIKYSDIAISHVTISDVLRYRLQFGSIDKIALSSGNGANSNFVRLISLSAAQMLQFFRSRFVPCFRLLKNKRCLSS